VIAGATIIVSSDGLRTLSLTFFTGLSRDAFELDLLILAVDKADTAALVEFRDGAMLSESAGSDPRSEVKRETAGSSIRQIRLQPTPVPRTGDAPLFAYELVSGGVEK
jgi:hypothetical protein